MVLQKARINHLMTALLLAVALVFLAGGSLAYAGMSICRSDPIVFLSDGQVVTLYADIETDQSNLESVDYFLRVPPGVSVLALVHPDPLTADLETFSYAADGDAKKLTATTLVKLRDGSATRVTAYMDVLSAVKNKFKSTTVSGLANEELVTVYSIKK